MSKNSKKKIRIFFSLSLVILVMVFVLRGGKLAAIERNQVCFEDQCVEVEIARTKTEHARGLQFRSSLPEDQGMLFIFSDTRRHSFWMKDTLIPLDIIWLDESGQIVYMLENVPICEQEPCPIYTPSHEARYVLEINAGRSSLLNIKEGESADFKLLESL